jgi:hypothetical protein
LEAKGIMDEEVEVGVDELSWACTLDAAMARATKVERAKRGIVLKSGGLCRREGKRGERRKRKRENVREARQHIHRVLFTEHIM